jgi:hypothetical protein
MNPEGFENRWGQIAEESRKFRGRMICGREKDYPSPDERELV